LLALAAFVTGLWVASDGRHHWDEPTYLYAGAYVSLPDILDGQVQPSGIEHFTQGRVLHGLLVKAVMQAMPSPPAGFAAMIALNLLLLAGSVWFLHRILRGLLPGAPFVGEATTLVAMCPVILYFAFRVLADAEALFAGLLATWALLRIAQGAGLAHGALAAFAIALCTLSKNQMAWLPASFWAIFCLIPITDIDRRRLALRGAVSGMAAVVLTLATLEAIGVGLEAYWSSYRNLYSGTIPVTAKLLNVGTELGLLWLLLPFAFLTSRRRELAAFIAWLALSMAPFLFVINSIEARHVAVNLVAVGALFVVALEALAARWRQAASVGTALAAIALVMSTNAVVLAVMPHRIHTGQMRAALDALDNRFGRGGYVLLTATGYTDFHMIRVLWPDVDVRDPSTAETYVHPGARGREEALEAWYQGRQVGSVEALRRLGKPVAWLGYGQTFAAENLNELLGRVSPALARRVLGKVALPDRLFARSTEWLWGDPAVKFQPIARIGHYRTYAVQLAPP
jgi:hypothetical protein